MGANVGDEVGDTLSMTKGLLGSEVKGKNALGNVWKVLLKEDIVLFCVKIFTA